MDQTRINQVIKYLTDELTLSGIEIDTVILFGSCSTGLATDQSDIDIAIVSKNFKEYEFSHRFHLLGKPIVKTIRQFHIPIDVIPLTPEEYKKENSIRMDFIRNGIRFNPDNSKFTFRPQAEV